jgi:hypothetical protein
MIKVISDYLGVSAEINLGQILLAVTFVITQTKGFLNRYGKNSAVTAVNEMRLRIVEKNTELAQKELEKIELKIAGCQHDTNNLRMSMMLVKAKLNIPLSEKEQAFQ